MAGLKRYVHITALNELGPPTPSLAAASTSGRGREATRPAPPDVQLLAARLRDLPVRFAGDLPVLCTHGLHAYRSSFLASMVWCASLSGEEEERCRGMGGVV